MTKEDLGTMGESEFQNWCASAGLIANRSIDKDAAGWDYFVEFDYEFEITSQTLHQACHECKIQVKSTRKERKGEQITLSNLRRACTSQLPNFILFLEYDTEKSPQRVYLVHIGKEIIEKSLGNIFKKI